MKNPKKNSVPRMAIVNPLLWIPALLWYIGSDILTALRRGYLIMYGVVLYVGEVGSGKTLGMVERALRLKRRDNNIVIWSNFYFRGCDYVYTDLDELKNIPSYSILLLSEGALLANNRDWSRFPAGLLEMLTQNRKWGIGDRPPGVLMLWDVQDPMMLDTNVRRLTNAVVECKAVCDFGNGPRLMLQRWVRPKEYFSKDDNTKVKTKAWFGYIATDRLRSVYDTYVRINKV